MLQKEPNMIGTSSFKLVYSSVLAPLFFKLLLMFIKLFRAKSLKIILGLLCATRSRVLADDWERKSYRRAPLTPPRGAILKCGNMGCPPSRLWLFRTHFQWASVQSAPLFARPPCCGLVLRVCFKPKTFLKPLWSWGGGGGKGNQEQKCRTWFYTISQFPCFLHESRCSWESPDVAMQMLGLKHWVT